MEGCRGGLKDWMELCKRGLMDCNEVAGQKHQRKTGQREKLVESEKSKIVT